MKFIIHDRLMPNFILALISNNCAMLDFMEKKISQSGMLTYFTFPRDKMLTYFTFPRDKCVT